MLDSSRKRAEVYIIPFFITAIMLFVIFYKVGIYPFGERSLLIWDLRWQYIQFFSWFKQVLTGGGNLFYSFNAGMGNNMIGLYAYYLASPLNLLILFFNDIQIFVLVLTILKLALAASASAFFMRNRFSSIDNIWIIVLATCYGVMSYSISQKCNLMWLDALIMLPLICLGIYRLIMQNKKTFLFISVLVMVVCNWYMAYMCCLFSVVYFFFELFCTDEKKKYIVTIVKYGLTMLLAVMSSMVLFLPTAMNLLQGKGIESTTDYTPGFHIGIKTLIKGLLPGIRMQKAFGTESQGIMLFCGTFVLICAAAYFLSKRSLKEKILSALVLSFLVVSATFIPLENVWNGFRKANSYYCRFSFVISFFIIYLAAAYLEKSVKFFHKKWFRSIVCMWVCVELLFNGYSIVRSYAPIEGHAYSVYDEQQKERFAGFDISNSEFYRTEQASPAGEDRGANYLGVFNEGLQYGYHSFATYTSTINSALTELYHKCGYHDYYKFMQYNEPLLLTDSLWGIRYIISDHTIEGCEKDTDAGVINGKSVYVNPYALNLGYCVQGADIENIEAENPFEYQNKILSTLTGEDIECFKRVDAQKTVLEDGDEFQIKVPKEEHILYGYIDHVIKDAAQTVIYINGDPRTTYSRVTSYKTFQVDDPENSDIATVAIKGNLSNKDELEGVFYYLDMKEFSSAIDKLKTKMFQVEDYGEGKITGTYTAVEDNEKLMLTIPYDKGWKIKCNGETVTADPSRTFTVLQVKKGENKIEMTYVSPGFKEGFVISLLAILLFAIWQKAEKKVRRSEDV